MMVKRVIGAVMIGAAAAQAADVMSAAYRAQWSAPEVRERIERGIRENRMAEARVTLPSVPAGAEVKVEQLDHAFLFGANIFNFDQLGSDELNRRYKEVFGTLFNAATVGFYWKAFEPAPGQPRYLAGEQDSAAFWNAAKESERHPFWRRPSPEKIIAFCEAKGIAMHGHPLVYVRTDPAWMPHSSNTLAEAERLYEKHVAEMCGYYKGRIPSWDIVNESVDPVPGKPRYGAMPDDYTFKVYQWAEKGFPAAVRFCINDSWRDVYPPFIRGLIARGAKIDVVGLQMHIFGAQPCLDIAAGKTCFPNGTSWKPLDVIKYLEALDTLRRPIHLSEITIPAPGSDETANAIQAELTRDMYRLWFSWPSIYRITWWNVVDDCGFKGEPLKSGLFTRQMEPKPAFHALNRLINDEWRTRLTVKAGAGGNVAFRGFKGRYRLTYADASGAAKTAEFQLLQDGDGAR